MRFAKGQFSTKLSIPHYSHTDVAYVIIGPRHDFTKYMLQPLYISAFMQYVQNHPNQIGLPKYIAYDQVAGRLYAYPRPEKSCEIMLRAYSLHAY